MTGFELHRIEHLSASSLNAAASQIAMWVCERLLDKKIPVGSAAHRGTAAEAGVTLGLLYPEMPVSKCQAVALEKYNLLTSLSGDPSREKERDAVAPIVETTLAELRQYGMPDLVQERIETPLGDGLPPLLGFADFVWTRHGLVGEMKTTLRIPSEVSDAHARQVSVYTHNSNRAGRVFYCGPKKIAAYVVEDVAERFAQLENIARRLDRFLAISADPMELAALVIPDAGHWLWNNPQATAIRKEVYGF